MSNINSLENKLYSVDFNDLKELHTIKQDAISQLNSKTCLSKEKRTIILNTILVLNEVIMNTTAEKLPEGDSAKDLYKNVLKSSVSFLTNVTSQDKIELKGLEKSVRSLETAWKNLSEGDTKQSAKQMLEDLMLYGTTVLTTTTNCHDDISVKLKSLDSSIEMLATTGDGNCFYNAISTSDWILQHQDMPVDHKNKHEERYAELRQKTIEHMEILKVPDAEIKRHSADRYWATEMQIQYLAAVEEKPILVLSLNPNKSGELAGSIYLKEGSDLNPNDLRVIMNIDNVHFNALFTTLEASKKLINTYNTIPVK